MHAVTTRSLRSMVTTAFVAAVAVAGALSLLPGQADATPAYARRFGVECATCHSPNPARLNNVGMVFRRSGFRLPDADENGKLMQKVIPAHTIGEALAIAGQMDYSMLQSADAAGQGVSKSSAQLSEVELIAGTSVGDRYSAQMLYIPYNDVGESELENMEVQMNYGKPESQFIVRAGQAQPLIWQKAGHGSMTMSSPLILDEASATPVGSFAGPGLGHMLPMFEVGYMATQLQKGKLSSTMVSLAATNGYAVDGSSARTHQGDGVDVLAQATQLWGSRNTANVFYYDGHTSYASTDTLAPGMLRDRFTRYGVTGNFAAIDQLDLAAGFAGGKDESTELGSTVKQTGYYVEATGQVMPRWVATYRYDSLDPNTDVSDDTIKANTLGTTFLLDSAVFLSAEWREVQAGTAKSHGVSARIRVLY